MKDEIKQKLPSDKPSKKKFAMVTIYILFVVLVVLSALCPYFVDNARTLFAAKSIQLNCSRTIKTYDDNHNIISEKTISGDFVGNEISSISKNSSILWVNHIPNQFVVTSSYGEFTTGVIERVDNLTKAEYGTLEFVFFNLDPTSKSFKEQASSLSRFWLNSEKMVYFDFYLPFSFDAATIYDDISGYISVAGDMGEYNPQKYLSTHRPLVPNVVDKAPQSIRLNMVMDPVVPVRLDAARIVTVHYRAKNGVSFAGNVPFAGTRTAVKHATETRMITHIIFLTVAGSLALTFLVLILLKRTFSLIGQWGILISVIFLLLAGLIPLIGSAAFAYKLLLPSVALLFLSAITLTKPHGKVLSKVRTPFIVLCAVNLLLTILLTFTAPQTIYLTYAKVTSSILSTAAIFLACSQWRKDLNAFEPFGVFIAAVSGILSVQLTFSSVLFLTPATLVAVFTIPIVLWIIIADIFRTERRNANLTHNLAAEVAVQTAVLGSALSDREKILSFLSHDMRKSALGIKALTDEMERRTTDDDMRNYAGKIERKNEILLNSFSNILEFTKQNFTNETFTSFPISDLISDLDLRVRPDCEANGIDLTLSTKKVNVRAKRSSLLSVLFNLVFNAIEHSACTKISIITKKSSGRVIIKVADNGKGIPSTAGIFNPYVSDNDADGQNTGLGLFIVKSETEAMGGTISYESRDGSVFTLTLLSDD